MNNTTSTHVKEVLGNIIYMSSITSINNIVFSILSYIWIVFLILSYYFGYSIFFVTEKTMITTICKKIKYCTLHDDQNEPYGFFIENIFTQRFFCGYKYHYQCQSDDGLIYCFCSLKTLNNLKINEMNKINECQIIKDDKKYIKVYERTGTYYHLSYKLRNLDCTRFIVKPKQKILIDNIIEYYQEHDICVAIISGNPGTGKSISATLLTSELSGSLCQDFRPNNPGDFLTNIYNVVGPTKNNPLILLLDEFDIIIASFYNIEKIFHKSIPTQTYDKVSWNTLFDKIQSNFYPYLIIILTTNISKDEFITKYEESYIRKGRVNLFLNL